MLHPDIQWREQYTSASLNRKLAGIIPTGVYRGFAVTENGNNTVTVDTLNGVAVCESNGYSLTVRGDGTPETLTVPDGGWKIVIRGSYAIGGPTTAVLMVVADDQPGDALVASARTENNVTQVAQEPQVSLGGGTGGNGGYLDFGEIVDLGLINQNFGGENIDLGGL